MINDGDCHPTLTPPDGLIWQRGFEICDKMKICVTLKFSGMKTPSAGEFVRWSCRFAPAPSGETVPVWAGCTQSAHPSHTRTEAKK